MTAQFIDTAALLRDPLMFVREGGRAIGYVGIDIPEEILAAKGTLAAHLPWARGRNTPWADRWLESSFAGWARSIVEDWAAGRFNFMDYVIFTRGDDTSQRLYYYVSELQRCDSLRGPAPLIFDTARIRRPTSEEWTIAAVRKLADELGLDDDDLLAGITAANARRDALASVDADRRFPSSYYEQVARGSLFAPADRLSKPAIGHGENVRRRVLMAGSSPPDDGLHLAVESAGWSVAAETYDRNLLRLGPLVDKGNADPCEQIGKAAFERQIGPRSFHDRSGEILAAVRSREIEAVIIWLCEEDEAIAWDFVDVRQALESAGISTLVLARRRWDLSDNPQIEIADFLGSLGT